MARQSFLFEVPPLTPARAQLEDLLVEIGDPIEPALAFMKEHLSEARGCLLGAMPQEYRITLELASELVPQVEPPVLRTRIEDFLRAQLSRPTPL